MEGGTELSHLIRYEHPVQVAIISPEFAAYQPDLENLLARLRNEAGIVIQSTEDTRRADILIQAVPRSEIQRKARNAACFIIPGVSGWNDFTSRRNLIPWSSQKQLGRTSIFIPSDGTPQTIRDCLHEEVGQALGPANDVYRFPDSIFNDDNYHSVLTQFDMLMLRVLYSPELRSGMTKRAVASELPDILERENPQGRGVGQLPQASESREWKRQIETAMTRGNDRSTRLRAADQAVRMAAQAPLPDHRVGVSLLTRGRLSIGEDDTAAAEDIATAYAILRRRFGENDVRTSIAALQYAFVSLAIGRPDAALVLTQEAEPAAREGENGILLAGLFAVQSNALLRLGRPAEAKARLIESLEWEHFAYGDANGSIAQDLAQLKAMSVAEFAAGNEEQS